jgi:GT2 family glycosyltransferase
MSFRRTASPAAVLNVPATGRPSISFIAVTFGTDAAMIDRCLRHLAASCAFDGVDAEVIVVDNLHPTDGHACGHHLANTTSGIRLALPDRNLGFGGGNELGIAAARAATICLINPDLVVHDGWLAPMLVELADHPGDVIAPRLLDAQGDLDEAGQLVGPDGHTAPAPDDAAEIDYASAACWLMQSSTHERIGGFDPRFHPAYFEDVDYAFRLRRIGHQIRLHPTVAVTHLRGGSVQPLDATTDVGEQLATFNELWKSELWRQPRLPTI